MPNSPPSPEPKCKKCNDTQIIQVHSEIQYPPGTSVPVRFCECREEKRCKKLIDLMVPQMWRGLRVGSLEPLQGLSRYGFSVKNQINIINELRSHPLGGHSFFGPSGTGKSRFLYCLLQEAIYAGKDVYYSKMINLIRAIRDYEFGRLPQERWKEMIDSNDLSSRKPSDPLYIFLDEIDKVPITDDVYLKILELFDFIYEHNESAVISVCSNLSTKKCEEVWGTAVTRRIMALTDVHIIVEEG